MKSKFNSYVCKTQVEKLFVGEVCEPWQGLFHFSDTPSALGLTNLSAPQIAIRLLGLSQTSVVGNIFSLRIHSIHLKINLARNLSKYDFYRKICSQRVDVVCSVLIDDALDPVVVLAQRLIGPPLLQISMQIVLSTFENHRESHKIASK